MRRETALAELQIALTMAIRRAAVPQLHERITRRAGVEIDRVEAIALSRVVDAGEMRLTALARQLGVACSTAGRHAAHLDKRGLCVRTIDPDDRRAVVVAATEAGRELIARLRRTHREILDEVLADWSVDDLTELTDSMDRLATALSRAVEPEAAVP